MDAKGDATPRTDALARYHYENHCAANVGLATELSSEESYVEMRDLAGAIERELSAERARRERCEEVLRDMLLEVVVLLKHSIHVPPSLVLLAKAARAALEKTE